MTNPVQMTTQSQELYSFMWH